MLCDDQGDVVCWVDLGISLDVPAGQRSESTSDKWKGQANFYPIQNSLVVTIEPEIYNF